MRRAEEEWVLTDVEEDDARPLSVEDEVEGELLVDASVVAEAEVYGEA